MERKGTIKEAKPAPVRGPNVRAASKQRAPASQPEREIFARNFRRARMGAGLSQREVQRLSGIAQAHISEIESAFHNVCIDTMVALAQVVKQPVFELMRP